MGNTAALWWSFNPLVSGSEAADWGGGSERSGKPTWRWVLLLCSVGLAASQQAVAGVSGSVAFEVTGTYTQPIVLFRDGLPAGQEIEQEWFRFVGDGRHWFMRIELATNRPFAWDYCEFAFDGTYQYQVVSIKSWVEAQKALGRRVGANTATALICKRPVPCYLVPRSVGPLWLAYGSADYFKGLTNGTVDCLLSLTVRGRGPVGVGDDYRVRAVVVPGPGSIPSRVTFLDTNAPEWQVPWPPRGLWWTRAVFAVQQFTNVDRFWLPLEATTTVFDPHVAPGEREVRLVEGPARRIQAATVRLVSPLRAWRPELPELTFVSDHRFKHEKHRPGTVVHYNAKGRWYTEAEVKRLPEYRKAAGLAPARATGVTAVGLLVLAALVSGPLLYYLVRKHWMQGRQ
jgi:hypothetical protein